MNRCVYEDRYFHVVVPEFPLNCREDGGHLVVVKKIPVTDRSDMSYQEAIAFMRISTVVHCSTHHHALLTEPKYIKMAELAEL